MRNWVSSRSPGLRLSARSNAASASSRAPGAGQHHGIILQQTGIRRAFRHHARQQRQRFFDMALLGPQHAERMTEMRIAGLCGQQCR